MHLTIMTHARSNTLQGYIIYLVRILLPDLSVDPHPSRPSEAY